MRKLASILVTVGLAVGLIGAGVSATWSDSATAIQNVSVGTFGCSVTSTDPHAVINGHSVTINLPDIVTSNAAAYFVQDVTVTNTGSIPQKVHWTFTTGGTLAPNQWQPVGAIGYYTGAGNPGDPTNMSGFDPVLAAGASKTYGGGGFGVGFAVANGGPGGVQLDNTYLGKTATVTYTANCGEVPPPPTSHISFVGLASEAGHAALTLPAHQVGDIAILFAGDGSTAVATPAGWTNITVTTAPRTNISYRFMVAGDTSVTPGSSASSAEVAIYRGVSGIGAHTYNSANANNIGLSGGSPLYYPAQCTSTALTNTGGSSWVACFGFDNYASSNMSQVSFQSIVSSSPTPYVLDGTIATNRSASNADAHIGLADSAAGVAAWPQGAWGTPGDNFPLPGTHGVSIHTIELLSQ